MLDVKLCLFISVCLPLKCDVAVGSLKNGVALVVNIATGAVEQATDVLINEHQAVENEERQDERFLLLFPMDFLMLDGGGCKHLTLSEDKRPYGHSDERAEGDVVVIYYFHNSCN